MRRTIHRFVGLLFAGLCAATLLAGTATAQPVATLPAGIDSLDLDPHVRYLRDADPGHFQPMNANFGLVEPLDGAGRMPKARKKELLVERAQADFSCWLAEVG